MLLSRRDGITVKELSERIGVSRASTSYYLNGKQMPREKTLKKIADVFGVDVDYLTECTSQIIRYGEVPLYDALVPNGEKSIGSVIVPYEMSRDRELYATTVREGDMYPIISHGDIIIISRQNNAETGDIAIIEADGKHYVRSVYRGMYETIFAPHGTSGKTFYDNNNKPVVKVLGKVVELRRRFNS